MATLCLNDPVFVTTSISFDIECVLPPVENRFGDTIYAPDKTYLIEAGEIKTYSKESLIFVIISLTLVFTLSAIVWLTGGVFMFYIPLYAALLPIFYWLIKIAYAFCLAKSEKFSWDDEKDFDQETIAESLIVKVIEVSEVISKALNRGANGNR